jgi:hypothetical protein
MPKGRYERNPPTERIGLCTVKHYKSRGSVWNAGELLAGYETPKDGDPFFSVFLCTQARELGRRGGVVTPAESVAVEGPTWEAVCDTVEELGFSRPTITEADVRRGYVPPKKATAHA